MANSDVEPDKVKTLFGNKRLFAVLKRPRCRSEEHSGKRECECVRPKFPELLTSFAIKKAIHGKRCVQLNDNQFF